MNLVMKYKWALLNMFACCCWGNVTTMKYLFLHYVTSLEGAIFTWFQYCTSLSRACLFNCSPKQSSHHSLRLMSCLCWCNLPAHVKNLTIAVKNSCVLALNYVHIFARKGCVDAISLNLSFHLGLFVTC